MDAGRKPVGSVRERLELACRDAGMSENDVVLWTVVLVATGGDVLLTLAGLAAGLQEGNVVVRTALAALGLPGFWLVKFLALCWLVVGWTLLPDRQGSAFLAIFALVTLAVVLNNALTILAI